MSWTAVRRAGASVLMVAAAALASGACGEDDPAGPDTLDLAEVEGLYEVLTITFDPQGSAPAADVLLALASDQIDPSLNVGVAGSFQLLYRDPVTRNVITVEGEVDPTEAGVELVFPSRAASAQFLFPLRLPLTYDPESGTLSFSGATEVSRPRLLELFPELYADEQLFDPTPGVLTVGFRKTGETEQLGAAAR